MTKLLLPIAVVVGLSLAWIDSRPSSDDTGIMACALFASCACLAAIAGSRPWLWAIAAGVWIPAVSLAMGRGPTSLIALVFAFAGAYAGWGMRKSMTMANAR